MSVTIDVSIPEPDVHVPYKRIEIPVAVHVTKCDRPRLLPPAAKCGALRELPTTVVDMDDMRLLPVAGNDVLVTIPINVPDSDASCVLRLLIKRNRMGEAAPIINEDYTSHVSMSWKNNVEVAIAIHVRDSNGCRPRRVP